MRAWIRVACGLAAVTLWQVAAAEGAAQAASLPKVENGSGFPARVIAVVP